MRGRYYRVPPGTPSYPGVQYLYSKNWDDKNFIVEATLGEDRTAKQTWFNGVPPTNLPGVDTVGNTDCIANGEIQSDRTNEVISGFPATCYLGLAGEIDYLNILTAFNSCSLQAFYIACVIAMYEQNPSYIETGFQLLLGNLITMEWHLGTPLLPDVFTVQTPTCNVVLIDGTANFQQAATQAFQGLNAPNNLGSFGTLPLWWNAATYVIELCEADNFDPELPIVFVGHSYGGAVALIAASRWKLGNPARQVFRFTFGSPKPGDQRLQQVIAAMPGLQLQNSGDFVTAVPPNEATLTPVAVALGLPILNVWALWFDIPSRSLLNTDGSLVPTGDVNLDFDTLLGFANEIINLNPLPAILPHSSSEYLRRTLLRCPNAEWPVTSAVQNWINNVPPITNTVILSEPGTGYWIAPAGVTTITVECWGAGAVGFSNNALVFSEGGGGGAYAAATLTVVPGRAYQYWIGFGYLGQPATNGITWFSSFATLRADCGGHRSVALNTRPGLGINSVGTVTFDGGWGCADVGLFRGGGGSSAGSAAVGQPTAPILSQFGGVAPAGGGDGGDGGFNGGIPTPGQPGEQPGGGGGGSTHPLPNAAGGDGEIHISW